MLKKNDLTKFKRSITIKTNSIHEFSIYEIRKIYDYCLDLANKLLEKYFDSPDSPQIFPINNAQSDCLFFDITLNYILNQMPKHYQYLSIDKCCSKYDWRSQSLYGQETQTSFKYHIKGFKKNCPELYQFFLKNKLIISSGKEAIKFCDIWGEVLFTLLNDFFQGNVPTLSSVIEFNDMNNAIDLITKLESKCPLKSLFHFYIEKKYSLSLYLDTLLTFCWCNKNQIEMKQVTYFISDLKYISLTNLPTFRLYIANIYKQLCFSKQINKPLDLYNIFFPVIVLDFLFTYALDKINKKFDIINDSVFINELEKQFDHSPSYKSVYCTIQNDAHATFAQEFSRITKDEYKPFKKKNSSYFEILDKPKLKLTYSDFNQISTFLNNTNMYSSNSLAYLNHLEERIGALFL